jgi:T5orf172 domain
MSYGYVYCFSNESMPGILKIGMTERTPDIRLNEANSSDTWRPPTPYKIEFAKKVNNPKEKELTLHTLLSQYTERINSKREFFRVSQEEVKTFFLLMDGDLWVKHITDEDDEEEEEADEFCLATKTKSLTIKGSRDTTKCFTNGQRIRHTIGINKTWIGVYNSSNNTIICNDQIYQGRSPLNQFAQSHYKTERPDRTFKVNAWSECECEVNGEWISTYNL